MFTRRAARALALAAGLTVPLAGAGSAFGIESGEVPDPLSAGKNILIFVVVPIVSAALITLLTFLPGWLRSPRYRPSREWDHDPLWFGAPVDAEQAMTAATDSPAMHGGGASAGW